MEAKIHRDMLSLFYSVWTNPDTKIYQIVKIILSEAKDNSSTWAINLRHICKLYSLENPLSCLQKDPPTKSCFKENVRMKISSFHEKELKEQASSNSKMLYFNVNLFSLRGRHHPCLDNIITTEDVKKVRAHLKFLCGDYFTYETRYNQTGKGSSICKMCYLEPESICHIAAECKEYDDIRTRITSEVKMLLSKMNLSNTQKIFENENVFTQFMIDPSSFNLDSDCRVNINDPMLNNLFKLSRDFFYVIDNTRKKKLKQLEDSLLK